MRCGKLLGFLILAGSIHGYGKYSGSWKNSWVTGLVAESGEVLHKFRAETGPAAMRKCQEFRKERRVPEKRPSCKVLWSPDHPSGQGQRLWLALEEVGTDIEDLPLRFFFADRREQAQEACELRRQQEFDRRQDAGEHVPEEWEISCESIR